MKSTRPIQTYVRLSLWSVVAFMVALVSVDVGLRWWDYREREADRRKLMAYAFITERYVEEIQKLNTLGVLGKVIKQSEEIAKQRGERLGIPLEAPTNTDN